MCDTEIRLGFTKCRLRDQERVFVTCILRHMLKVNAHLHVEIVHGRPFKGLCNMHGFVLLHVRPLRL